MRRIILILGNSHINSFRRCFGKILEEKGVSADIVYVMTNLLKTQWGDFANNAYLRYLQYNDNIAPDIDLRDRRIKIDLVLVGMGLLGTGILLPYGKILSIPLDDMEHANEYTPKLPLLSGIPGGAVPRYTTDLISEENARITYKNFYKTQISRINQLRIEGKFKSINWIAEPDMTESAGTFRFGEDLVQSGLYGMHRRLARNVFDQLIEEYGYQDKFILHPEHNTLPSGFIDDRFRASVNSFDLHVAPDYFRESSLTLFDRLDSQRRKFSIFNFFVRSSWRYKK